MAKSIAKTKGVDISSHNGNVSFRKIKKAGYQWVMIRCGFGDDSKSQDDAWFEKNVKKAKRAGLPWGVYFYTYSLSPEQDKSELKHILRLLKGKKPTLPVAIDVEDADGYKRKHGGWNFANVNRNAKYLLEGVKKAGYYPVLYTGFEEINNYISKEVWGRYDMWIAHWAKKCGYTKENLSIWQYGGETNELESTTIPGIAGHVDKDYMYKDYPSIIKKGGYNNWKKKKKTKKIVKFKKKGSLYSAPYKDLVGSTSKPKVSLQKGSQVQWLSDNKKGWSKVKYLDKTYYTLNSNLKKVGLSKCKTIALKDSYSVFEITKKNQKGTNTKLKKGTKVKVICVIEEGTYKNWSYCKTKDKKYYIKSKLI